MNSMPISKQILTIAGSVLALASGIVFRCPGSLAKEKPGYQKLLPKLDSAPRRPESAKKLKGHIGQSVTIEMKDAGNPWGYVPFGTKLPQTVSLVVPQSPAYRGGLRADDKILAAQLAGKKAEFVVERGGKKYSCSIILNDLASQPKQPDSAAAKELANHEIVLLIDSSASMNTKDCPGGTSRWDWCRNQATTLYNEGKQVFKNQISITTFNSQFQSHTNCKIEDLEKIFAQSIPSGETNMAPAIADALSSVSSQIYSGKPAVIAVVTDGRPTDIEALKNKIKQIANDLRNPELLTIAFIEIGTPERYLSELDNDLVKQGAKADIVTVFPFSAVNGDGLAKTMAKAVASRQAHKDKLSPAPTPPVRIASPATAESDDNPPPAPKALPAKPSAEQLEQQRIAREKREAEESRVRRAAANNSYDFSKPQPPSSPNPPVKPAAPAQKSAQTAVEVDEKESLRHQESNRSYGSPAQSKQH